MKPQLYHGQYESNAREWPGQHHFVNGRHGYCGRASHEVHNHDIWNTHVGGGKFRTSSMNDICFAYLGHIQYFQVYGSYKQTDDKTFKNWMTVTVGLQSNTWTWHCMKISDELDATYSQWKDADSDYYDISNIRIKNRCTRFNV